MAKGKKAVKNSKNKTAFLMHLTKEDLQKMFQKSFESVAQKDSSST